MWTYVLRRIIYAENSELISAFHYNGKDWIETEPIVKVPGQYEAPVAACTIGGKPEVAWESLYSRKLSTHVSKYESGQWSESILYCGERGS
jgi:hypothetical protein